MLSFLRYPPQWWKRGRLSLTDSLTLEQARKPNYCISLHCERYISQFWQLDSKHVVLAPLPPGEKEAVPLSVWAWKKYIIPCIIPHCIVNAFLSLQIVHYCPSLPPGEKEAVPLSVWIWTTVWHWNNALLDIALQRSVLRARLPIVHLMKSVLYPDARSFDVSEMNFEEE